MKWQESSRTSHNHHAVSTSRQISKNQSTGNARIYYYNISHARTIPHRTEASRALRTCHIHARVATTILKCQETSRTGHNHHAVSKSRKISKNQSTGHARICHYNMTQARTIQNRTEPSRFLRTCHIHARVAKTILKRQESSRTSHNHHAVSKSRQISKNQSTGHARIYHYNISNARTIQHRTKP